MTTQLQLINIIIIIIIIIIITSGPENHAAIKSRVYPPRNKAAGA